MKTCPQPDYAALHADASAAHPTDYAAKQKHFYKALALWYADNCPDLYDRADDIMLHHTTYSRRSYSGQVFTWADITPPPGVGDMRLDPWPGRHYVRAALVSSICQKLSSQEAASHA